MIKINHKKLSIKDPDDGTWKGVLAFDNKITFTDSNDIKEMFADDSTNNSTQNTSITT